MQATAVFDALGDPTRRAVLEILRDGPSHVEAVAAQLPVSRPAVSRHLAVLQGAGLVTAQTLGRQRLYSVAPAGLAVVQEWVVSFWDDALDALAKHVEET